MATAATTSSANAPPRRVPRTSQRFVMLVSPEERALWGERAGEAGISTADFVRQSANALEPGDLAALAELRLLLPEAQEHITAMRATLRHMADKLEYWNDPARDIEMRERALASITEDEIEAMASLLA